MCYLIRIFGRVQGVLFRDSARRRAKALGLFGYVRNCDDGSVEILAQANNEEKINEFIKWCHKGPLLSRVDRVEVRSIECPGEFQDFSIRY